MADLDWSLRKGRVTASMISQLIPGAYPDTATFRGKDALDAFNKVTGRHVDACGESDGKRAAGHRIERFLLDWYAEREGVEWAHFGSVLHPRAPWFLATPDAVSRSSIGAKVVVEVKSVGLYMAEHWGEEFQGPDGVPPYVFFQAEAQAEVADADECHVVGYFGATDFRVYKWERDVTLGANLVEVATRFFRDHIEKDDPPPPGPWTSMASIVELFPKVRRPLEPAPLELEDDVAAFFAARELEQRAKEQREALAAKIAAVIGDREGLIGDGWRARFGERAGYRVEAYDVKAQRVLDIRRNTPKAKAKKGPKAA